MLKKNPGRKDRRIKARSNRRAAGRARAKQNEQAQKNTKKAKKKTG